MKWDQGDLSAVVETKTYGKLKATYVVLVDMEGFGECW